MKFCKNCQYMLYIRLDAENSNKLINYCRNCGNEDHLLDSEKMVISKHTVKKNQQDIDNIINKYTKLDPTLPRISRILCPNSECQTNTHEKPREIIYIRYDDINMKYLYLCSTCDSVWKGNDTINK